jgi:hypothetical protein
MKMQHLKRRHKKMHKSPRLKNKRSPKKSTKKSEKRAVSQRLVAHRTVNNTCPVCTGLSGGTTGQSAQRGRRKALSGCGTGLSGVPWADSNGRIQRSTARRQRSTATGDNGRLTWVHRTSTVQCPVVHRTVRCTRRQKAAAFCPTASWGLGGYKYHPNRPFEDVGAQATYQAI